MIIQPRQKSRKVSKSRLTSTTAPSNAGTHNYARNPFQDPMIIQPPQKSRKVSKRYRLNAADPSSPASTRQGQNPESVPIKKEKNERVKRNFNAKHQLTSRLKRARGYLTKRTHARTHAKQQRTRKQKLGLTNGTRGSFGEQRTF